MAPNLKIDIAMFWGVSIRFDTPTFPRRSPYNVAFI